MDPESGEIYMIPLIVALKSINASTAERIAGNPTAIASTAATPNPSSELGII